MVARTFHMLIYPECDDNNCVSTSQGISAQRTELLLHTSGVKAGLQTVHKDKNHLTVWKRHLERSDNNQFYVKIALEKDLISV